MKRGNQFIANIVFYLVLITVLLGALKFATNSDPSKTILGYRGFEVLSNSMSPEIQRGDLVLVKQVDPSTLSKGEVITYFTSDGKAKITHRVAHLYVENNRLMLVTKGDQVNQEDAPIDAEQVLGVVKGHIPYLGGFLGEVKQKPVLYFTGLLGTIMILGLVKYGISLLRSKDEDALI